MTENEVFQLIAAISFSLLLLSVLLSAFLRERYFKEMSADAYLVTIIVVRAVTTIVGIASISLMMYP